MVLQIRQIARKCYKIILLHGRGHLENSKTVSPYTADLLPTAAAQLQMAADCQLAQH